MAFKLDLRNNFSKDKMELKICDADETSVCTRVGGAGRGSFPTKPGTLDRLKVTPTDNTGSMQEDWRIDMNEYIDEFYFLPGCAVIREISYSRKDQQLTIRLLKGGTRNWALTITKPEEKTPVESQKEYGPEQTSNVTIGDDFF